MSAGTAALSRTAPVLKVLIVEDEPALAEILEYNLMRSGYEVLVASDGRSGHRMVEEHRPCAILLDAMLPDLNGFELCRTLKSHKDQSIASIPIVFVSALADQDHMDYAFSLGADGYFTKPYSVKMITDCIQSLARSALKN